MRNCGEQSSDYIRFSLPKRLISARRINEERSSFEQSSPESLTEESQLAVNDCRPESR